MHFYLSFIIEDHVLPLPVFTVEESANIESKVPYSQLYLVLGLVGLALWSVLGTALNKYRCEYGTLNSMFAQESIKYVELSEF